jgi:hypothetical protein
MTPEQFERKLARARIDNMTPEQIERRRVSAPGENWTTCAG